MQNDLISRSALKKTFEDAGLGDHSLIESVLAAGVYAGIENAPTIDAVPVVHAKWEIVHGMINPKYSGRKRCTRCGDISPNDMCGREMLSHYCPNCGAKMDAKDMDVPTKDGGASDG